MSTDLMLSPRQQRPGSKVHFEDDVDDTDPRLGIPAMTGEERTIAERYRRRRSPMPFVVHRNCVTSRDEKTKSQNRQSRSDNHVSVLCTPRDKTSRNVGLAYCNGDLRKAESQLILNSQRTEKLRPEHKYSSYFSSQPNLSIETKNLQRDYLPQQEKANGYAVSERLANFKVQNSLQRSSFPSENHLNYCDKTS